MNIIDRVYMNSTEKKVRERLNDLGSVEICYPIDIFSISNQIAEELFPNNSVDIIIQDYSNHENAFVRRAILAAIRFIGPEFAEKNIPLIRKSLKDEDDWVVYDAAWILFDMSSIEASEMETLKLIANELSTLSSKELELFEPKEATDYASKKAAQAVLKHS